ncbi:MAG: hypothetical protein ACRD2L_07270 [Terriglobia bacterium]
MKNICVLEAYGFKAAFCFLQMDSSEQNVETTIDFSLDEGIDLLTVRSVPTWIALKDITRLAAYLNDHVSRLLKGTGSESFPFGTMELGFELQALEGEALSDSEGEFTLRLMINVGQVPHEGLRVYVGGQAVVSVENIRRFVASLDSLFDTVTL